ncbi:MAG: hypothetical protein U0T83_03515 [Bacteriovoracaceae bacterium]
MKNHLLILILSSLLFLTCSKDQSPSAIETKSEQSSNIAAEEKIKEQNCSKINLNKDVLLHANLINFFKCSKWDKEYPELFSSLAKISETSWNNFFIPINEIFFNDRVKRNQWFDLIKKLDEKQGLSDLSTILNTTFNQNFYNTWYRLFSTAKSNIGNKKANPNLLSKEDFFKLFDSFLKNPKSADLIHKFLKNVFTLIRIPGNDPTFALKNLSESPDYLENRIKLLDNISSYLNKEQGLENIRMVRDMLNYKNKPGSEDYYYLHLLIKNNKLTYNTFIDFIKFPLNQYPQIQTDFTYLRSYFTSGIPCTNKNTNQTIYLDIKRDTSTYINNMITLDFEDFLSHYLTVYGNLLTGEVMCQLKTTFGEFNIFDSFNNITLLLKTPIIYELVKTMHLVSSKPTTAKPDPYFMFDFVQSDTYRIVNDLWKVLLANISTDENLPLITFNLLKSINKEIYDNAVEVLNLVTSEDNLKNAALWAKLWNNLTIDEKKYLLNIFDSHFTEPVNNHLLFQFYVVFFEDISKYYEKLNTFYVGDNDKKELFFNSILDVSSHFQGEGVLKDLKRFFSPNQIIKTINTIIKNSIYTETHATNLALAKPSITPDKDLTPLIFIPNEQAADAYVNCSKVMTDIINRGQTEGTYYILRNFPVECKNTGKKGFINKLISNVDVLEKDFAKNFYKDETPVRLVDPNGAFGNDVLHWGLTLILICKEQFSKVATAGNSAVSGIRYVLSFFKNEFFGTNFNWLRETLIQTLEVTKLVEKQTPLFFDTVLTPIINFSDAELVLLTEQLLKVAVEYKKELKSNEIKGKAVAYTPYVPCKNDPAMKDYYGVDPCYNKEQLKKGIVSIIKILGKKNKEVNPFLENFLAFMHPGKGINVPVGGTDKYVADLKTLLSFFFDMGKSEDYQKKYVYYDKNNKYTSEASLINRIEIVLRDIGFSKNFYGAAWGNSIAASKKYITAADEKYSDIKLINSAGAYYRAFNIIPPESEWLLKNCVNAYPSLQILDSKYGYGEYFRGLQSAIVGSSPKDTQMFSKFKNPDEEFIKDHNSHFLLLVGQLSGMRHIHNYLIKRFKNKETLINHPYFNRINENLMSAIPYETLAPILRELFDKYPYEIVDVINTTIDLIDETIDLDDTNKSFKLTTLEKLLVNTLYLSTYLKSTADYLHLAPQIFKHWFYLKKLWKTFGIDIYSVAEKINPFLEAFNNLLIKNDKELVNFIATTEILTKSILLGTDKRQGLITTIMKLLEDEATNNPDAIKSPITSIAQASYKLFNHLMKATDFYSADQLTLFSSEVHKVLSHPKFTLKPIKTWMNYTLQPNIDGLPNLHYQEFYHLFEYSLLVTDESTGERNIDLMKSLFFYNQNFDDFISFMENLCLSIKFD